MDYFSFNIVCKDDKKEALMALLSEQPFDTFEETADGFKAYLPTTTMTSEVESAVIELQQLHDFEFEKQFYPTQNWNELWESNFQPVLVEDFCGVRAEFHPNFGESVQHELVIQPKMAFGTGHHDTTWLCMKKLKDLPIDGKILLDFGCGTGILGILAARLGATSIEAVDIEQESYLNTLENAERNNVPNIVARCGTLENVEGTAFDGILANINRNVILASLPRLFEITRPGGWLLVSGILLDDEKMVSDAAIQQGYQKTESGSRNNWMYILFEKKITN